MESIEKLQKMRVRKDPYEIDEYTEYDDFGFYMTGTFLYHTHLVIVAKKEGRWHLSVKSRTPLGLHQIEVLRDKFIPAKVNMAHVILPHSMRSGDNTRISLWEVS